jgi:hypothetical protein
MDLIKWPILRAGMNLSYFKLNLRIVVGKAQPQWGEGQGEG